MTNEEVLNRFFKERFAIGEGFTSLEDANDAFDAWYVTTYNSTPDNRHSRFRILTCGNVEKYCSPIKFSMKRINGIRTRGLANASLLKASLQMSPVVDVRHSSTAASLSTRKKIERAVGRAAELSLVSLRSEIHDDLNNRLREKMTEYGFSALTATNPKRNCEFAVESIRTSMNRYLHGAHSQLEIENYLNMLNECDFYNDVYLRNPS